MTNNKTYDHLTDEELLKEVYFSDTATLLEVELANRLEHVLDELAKKPGTPEQFVEGLYGNNARG